MDRDSGGLGAVGLFVAGDNPTEIGDAKLFHGLHHNFQCARAALRRYNGVGLNIPTWARTCAGIRTGGLSGLGHRFRTELFPASDNLFALLLDCKLARSDHPPGEIGPLTPCGRGGIDGVTCSRETRQLEVEMSAAVDGVVVLGVIRPSELSHHRGLRVQAVEKGTGGVEGDSALLVVALRDVIQIEREYQENGAAFCVAQGTGAIEAGFWEISHALHGLAQSVLLEVHLGQEINAHEMRPFVLANLFHGSIFPRAKIAASSIIRTRVPHRRRRHVVVHAPATASAGPRGGGGETDELGAVALSMDMGAAGGADDDGIVVLNAILVADVAFAVVFVETDFRELVENA